MPRNLGVATQQVGHADLSLPILSSQRKGRGGHRPSGLFHLGVFRTPGLRPIIMGRGVPRYGLCAAVGGSDDGMAGAQLATGVLFQGKCHNGGDQFFRLEFTIKDDSFSLPNHPEASSVYDAKSGDEAKIANCSPETLERFRCWGQVDTANKLLASKQMAKPEGWKRNAQIHLLGTPVAIHVMRDCLVPAAPDFYVRARGDHLRVPKLRPQTEPTEQASSSATTGGPGASLEGPPEPKKRPGGFAPGKSTVTLREAPLRFRPLTVNIYTFGLRFGEASFGVQLAHQFLPTYRAKKLSAQEQQQTDEELIRQWSSGLFHNAKSAVLVISALCFHDPNERTAGHADGMRSHLGTHLANIRCLLKKTNRT